MPLSEQLRQAREAHNLSQEALAEKLNLSRQAISKWERGASAPTPENLQALSAVLGAAFIPDTPPVPPEPRNPWKTCSLVLIVIACLPVLLYAFLTWPPPERYPTLDVYAFDETGVLLPKEYGWYHLTPGQKIIVAITVDTKGNPSFLPASAALDMDFFSDTSASIPLARRTIKEGETGPILFTWKVPEKLPAFLTVDVRCVGGSGNKLCGAVSVTWPT
ncbi:MAG: helix-turn-helix transcriptional regulator [Oscillibacter sp.]|nr:helix-turn-helix transcriptional regulator [Oscillibacter sp.]